MKRVRAEKLFQNVKTLPSLPSVVQKIFASINDSRVGAKQLGEIVTTDQSLTTRVLKLVNSSYFSLRGNIQNVHHAVTMLGFSTIRQLCLGVSIINQFNNIKEIKDFSGESFWKHSIAVSILAREISKTATNLEPDVCYTVGLIHDIGKLLFIEHHSGSYMEVLRKAQRESMPLEEAETETFDIDHTDVANWIFRKWNLSRDIRSAVRNHHSADTDRISPISPEALTGVVYFANQLAHYLNMGNSGNPSTHLEEEKFKKFFGTSFDDMDIDITRLEEEVHISLEILGIKNEVKSNV
jgi:putative nucleotidyltransferase with HDIG domain